MSDISVTLPQSAIFSVGFLPANICCLQVSRFGPVWTREGFPTEKTLTLKSAKNSQKVKSNNYGSNECVPLIAGVHIYRLLIMSGHIMGWAPVWAVGGHGPQSRSLSSIIVCFRGFTGNAKNLSGSRLVSLSYRLRPVTSLAAQAGCSYSGLGWLLLFAWHMYGDYLRLWELCSRILWLQSG